MKLSPIRDEDMFVKVWSTFQYQCASTQYSVGDTVSPRYCREWTEDDLLSSLVPSNFSNEHKPHGTKLVLIITSPLMILVQLL